MAVVVVVVAAIVVVMILVVAVGSATVVVAATRRHLHEEQLTTLDELVGVGEAVRGGGVDEVVRLVDPVFLAARRTGRSS